MIISVFFWMADRDPFGKIKKTLLEDILISSSIKMVVPILFSLMVETIFTEAGPTSLSYNLAQVVVKLHSLSCLTFFSVSTSTKITYCLLPILVIWALAYRFRPSFQAIFPSKLLAFLRLSWHYTMIFQNLTFPMLWSSLYLTATVIISASTQRWAYSVGIYLINPYSTLWMRELEWFLDLESGIIHGRVVHLLHPIPPSSWTDRASRSESQHRSQELTSICH